MRRAHSQVRRPVSRVIRAGKPEAPSNEALYNQHVILPFYTPNFQPVFSKATCRCDTSCALQQSQSCDKEEYQYVYMHLYFLIV